MAASPSSSPINTSLYHKYTDEVIFTIFGGLSLSSMFAISIDDSINLLAYDASLPGTSYQTTDIYGDIQGVTQSFANRRSYSPVDISFYIKSDYSAIKYFDDWVQSISPLSGPGLQQNSYVKFNYPSIYKKDINIVKYERDYRPKPERLTQKGSQRTSAPNKTAQYTLINAYPTNISAIPVSFDQSSILRITATFNYDRYHLTLQ